jgi:hypothetical protein
MNILSDGAFKLFVYVSLQADRSTGGYQTTQTELARVLGKSRRIIGKDIAEVEGQSICAIKAAKNQHARNTFQILDDYWPYVRPGIGDVSPKEEAAYVAALRDSFLATGCTLGTFGTGDVKMARALRRSGVALELVQQALLLGACRKYSSWLNGRSAQPIGRLYYFKGLISEVREQPLSPRVREYLQSKLGQLTRTWHGASSAAGDTRIRRQIGTDVLEREITGFSPRAFCLRKKVTSKREKKKDGMMLRKYDSE